MRENFEIDRFFFQTFTAIRNARKKRGHRIRGKNTNSRNSAGPRRHLVKYIEAKLTETTYFVISGSAVLINPKCDILFIKRNSKETFEAIV